mgnify:CR=1 FL=1
MANPRAITDKEGIDVRRTTYSIDGSTIVYDKTKSFGSVSDGVNLAVTLSGNDIVDLAADGDAVLGLLEQVEADGKCTVSNAGWLKFKKGNAATVTVGKKIVGALGAASAKGYIREVNTAVAAELGKMRGIIEDIAGDPTIVVYLD